MKHETALPPQIAFQLFLAKTCPQHLNTTVTILLSFSQFWIQFRLNLSSPELNIQDSVRYRVQSHYPPPVQHSWRPEQPTRGREFSTLKKELMRL